MAPVSGSKSQQNVVDNCDASCDNWPYASSGSIVRGGLDGTVIRQVRRLDGKRVKGKGIQGVEDSAEK
ncbi:hypothetical protein Pmani_020762 [Petrolisthes manimaculis]|uniref:Uncharacterized protein n=1 Tax=Petrolisthes manimaculis TaxID=1843537 RepID=A0AAE1U297_9EUCA|nr:hypothetical protein Pmani_020762 [Petrolisthes manimaculis]